MFQFDLPEILLKALLLVSLAHSSIAQATDSVNNTSVNTTQFIDQFVDGLDNLGYDLLATKISNLNLTKSDFFTEVSTGNWTILAPNNAASEFIFFCSSYYIFSCCFQFFLGMRPYWTTARVFLISSRTMSYPATSPVQMPRISLSKARPLPTTRLYIPF